MQIKQLFLLGCLQNLFMLEADHICVKSCPLIPSFNYTPTMSNRQSFLAAQFLECVDEAISDIKKEPDGNTFQLELLLQTVWGSSK